MYSSQVKLGSLHMVIIFKLSFSNMITMFKLGSLNMLINKVEEKKPNSFWIK